MKKFSDLQALGFLFLIGFLVYFNALNHPFMIDDHAFFDEMDHRWQNLAYHFVPDKAKFLKLEGAQTEVYYRPLALVIPKVFYLLFGREVFLFHVSSLVLFVLACWMIFLVLRRLSVAAPVAFLASVFYLVHPINNIIVNFKTAVVFSVQLILMLGSLGCLLKREEGRGKRGDVSSFFLLSASLFLYVLATMCHESAMALPFYALLLFLFIDGKDNFAANCAASFRKTVFLWVALAVYFLLRMQWASLDENIFQKFAGYRMDVFEYLATVSQMAWWYLSRFVYPEGIVISVFFPVERSRVLLWLLALVVLALSWAALFFKSRSDRQVGWAMGWISVGFILLLTGSVFHGEDLMIEPHWFVFPSIGIFFLMAAMAWRMITSPLKKPAVVFVVLLILAWGLNTRAYNALWHQERRYCYYWLKVNPHFKPIHLYIARSFFAEGKLDQAAHHYTQALTGKYPDYLMYTNLGSIAMLKDQLDEAQKFLLRAIAIEPRAKTALNSLALLSIRKGNWQQAEYYLLKSIEFNRFNIAARWNLALIYRQKGELEKERKLYQEILAIDPSNVKAQKALAR